MTANNNVNVPVYKIRFTNTTVVDFVIYTVRKRSVKGIWENKEYKATFFFKDEDFDYNNVYFLKLRN
jgi:hypothetical protein